MQNVYDVLSERGYIEQATHEEEIRELLGKEKVTFYIGFDPTADSLHVGHFIQLMVMSHLQQHGHRPIAIIGGGTAMIGDPSGRTDMRTMMTKETIANNVAAFRKQMAKFIDFGDGTETEGNKALMLNNGDWLLNLNYVDLLREVGAHFSVNNMLRAECYKNRYEKGLTFLEFNYMIMQSYDFLHLYRNHNCRLQFGGSDQWSNIIGGMELIRRLEGDKTAYGLTFKLLTNSEGKKMGKTASGAVWLDANKTSPYEFYQYWRNIDDADVEKCLALLTFLPMDEVRRLGAAEGAEINKSKEVLAYEITKLIHGEEEAEKAQQAARALFGGGAQAGSIPTTTISAAEAEAGIDVLKLLQLTGLIKGTSEGRRLIEQGGLLIQDNKVTDFKQVITTADFKDNQLMIKKGKKGFHLVVIE
ncbi:MAG: tyrosine--tRNA ligase [Peptococcaceae bacterium]|nr:tyrosine--tRNA ligase [Peptococcaceae bacterium]